LGGVDAVGLGGDGCCGVGRGLGARAVDLVDVGCVLEARDGDGGDVLCGSCG
jgi:hypothetical protein